LPEYEANRDLLLRLQSRFQASLSPQIVAALTDKDVQKSRELYKIFKQTQKLEDFNNYYYRTKKQVVAKIWKTFKVDDIRGDELAIVTWLASFYEQLLAILGQEAAWAQQVVESPQPLLSTLLTQIMSSLDPPLQTRIRTSLDLDTGRHLVSGKQIFPRSLGM